MLKKFACALDDLLLAGSLEEGKRAKRQRAEDCDRSFSGGYKSVIYTKKNDKDVMAQLCDKYGSDKGSLSAGMQPYSWAPHTYAEYYSTLFAHCRQAIRRVFECGLGTNFTDIPSNMGSLGKPGASLRVWRDYFPNAEIFGADIDRRVLFQEDRISTFYVDQTDPNSIVTLWEQAGGNFDLMIDDGLHTFDAARCLFENSIDRLAPHGIYIIEDVVIPELPKYREYFEYAPYQTDIVVLQPPHTKAIGNNLVVARHKINQL